MYSTYFPQYQYPQRQDYIPQQIQSTQQLNNGFTIRPVASRAEAEAAQIPFDGSVNCFYDTSSGKIFAKTFNANNGTAPLITFSREAEVQTAPPEYATMDTITEMRQTINRLAEEIDKLKKSGKAVKANDAAE